MTLEEMEKKLNEIEENYKKEKEKMLKDFEEKLESKEKELEEVKKKKLEVELINKGKTIDNEIALAHIRLSTTVLYYHIYFRLSIVKFDYFHVFHDLLSLVTVRLTGIPGIKYLSAEHVGWNHTRQWSFQ